MHLQMALGITSECPFLKLDKTTFVLERVVRNKLSWHQTLALVLLSDDRAPVTFYNANVYRL